MEQMINPTGRLLELMREALNQGQSSSVLQVIANIFKVEVNNSKAIAEGVLELFELCSQARSATEKFVDGDRSIFLAPIDKLEALFRRMHLGDSWVNVRGDLNESTMAGLVFGDHWLTLKFSSSSPDNPLHISDFLRKLELLVEECLSSELAPELQKLFLRHLEALRAALLDFRVNGVEALERVLDEVAGSMIRHKDSVGPAFDAGDEFLSKFFDTIGKMNDLVSIGQNIFLLGAPAATFLLSVVSGS